MSYVHEFVLLLHDALLFHAVLFFLSRVSWSNALNEPVVTCHTLVIMEDTGSFHVVSEASWLLPGIRIVVIIESCRRLLKDERQAYEATKTELQMRKRHLLPSVQALRPGRYTSLVSLVSLVLLEVVEVLVFLAPEERLTNAPFLSSMLQAWFSISKCCVGSATFGFFTSFGSKCSRDSDGLVFSSLPKEALELMVLRNIFTLVWTSDIKIQISCVSIGGYGNLDSDAELDLLVVLKGFVKTRVVLSC